MLPIHCFLFARERTGWKNQDFIFQVEQVLHMCAVIVELQHVGITKSIFWLLDISRYQIDVWWCAQRTQLHLFIYLSDVILSCILLHFAPCDCIEYQTHRSICACASTAAALGLVDRSLNAWDILEMNLKNKMAAKTLAKGPVPFPCNSNSCLKPHADWADRALAGRETLLILHLKEFNFQNLPTLSNLNYVPDGVARHSMCSGTPWTCCCSEENHHFLLIVKPASLQVWAFHSLNLSKNKKNK